MTSANSDDLGAPPLLKFDPDDRSDRRNVVAWRRIARGQDTDARPAVDRRLDRRRQEVPVIVMEHAELVDHGPFDI